MPQGDMKFCDECIRMHTALVEESVRSDDSEVQCLVMRNAPMTYALKNGAMQRNTRAKVLEGIVNNPNCTVEIRDKINLLVQYFTNNPKIEFNKELYTHLRSVADSNKQLGWFHSQYGTNYREFKKKFTTEG